MTTTFTLQTKAGALQFEAAVHEMASGYGRGNTYIHFHDIGSLAPMHSVPGGVQRAALDLVRAEYGARRDHRHWELRVGLIRMPWEEEIVVANWL